VAKNEDIDDAELLVDASIFSVDSGGDRGFLVLLVRAAVLVVLEAILKIL